MKWDHDKDRILFALVLAQQSGTPDYQKMASKWPNSSSPDHPTARALSERIFKIKKDLEKLEKGEAPAPTSSKKSSQSESEPKITPTKRKNSSGDSKRAKAPKLGTFKGKASDSSTVNTSGGTFGLDSSKDTRDVSPNKVDYPSFDKNSYKKAIPGDHSSMMLSSEYGASRSTTPFPQAMNATNGYQSFYPSGGSFADGYPTQPIGTGYFGQSDVRTLLVPDDHVVVKHEPVSDDKDSDETIDDPAFRGSPVL